MFFSKLKHIFCVLVNLNKFYSVFEQIKSSLRSGNRNMIHRVQRFEAKGHLLPKRSYHFMNLFITVLQWSFKYCGVCVVDSPKWSLRTPSMENATSAIARIWDGATRVKLAARDMSDIKLNLQKRFNGSGFNVHGSGFNVGISIDFTIELTFTPTLQNPEGFRVKRSPLLS